MGDGVQPLVNTTLGVKSEQTGGGAGNSWEMLRNFE